VEVKLLPSQYSLLTSDAPVASLVAGIGYGKSFTLAHFVLQQVIGYPEAQGLIVANTYTQLQNATLPACTNLLDELGIQYDLVMSGAKKHLTIGSTRILIYSLEQYENIRGIEVGFIAGDEIAFARREAIDVIFGRLRDKRGSLKARFFTSPNGFNWFYDYVTKSKVELHKGKTQDNKNLPESYYQSLLALYGGEGSPLAKQELFGEFVNQTANSVYYAFKRTGHVHAVVENKSLPVYIGCDFNVQNMNYVAMQYTKEGFTVIKAVNLKDHSANTFSMASEIWSSYGSRAIVIPDGTANARKTSAEAGVTDFHILKNAGLRVEYTHNPRIKDRQNAVNMQFYRDRIKVSPECTNLIKELETLGQDQDEGSVSHAAVAMGYVIWKLEPLQTPRKASETLQSPFVNRK
jgi:hypothetical protein